MPGQWRLARDLRRATSAEPRHAKTNTRAEIKKAGQKLGRSVIEKELGERSARAEENSGGERQSNATTSLGRILLRRLQLRGQLLFALSISGSACRGSSSADRTRFFSGTR